MKNHIVLSLFAVALVGGCASTVAKLKGRDANLNYADYAGEPVSSFWMSSVDGWASVSGTEIFVRSNISKGYLVTVTGFCPNLEFAPTIGFESSAGQVDRFSKVIVGHNRCLVKEIRPIDMVRLKADRKALGEKAAAAK